MKHSNTHLLRMRRALCLILCLSLCLPLSACSTDPYDFSIKETILYEKGGFVITANESKPKDHFEIDLTIKNDTNIDGSLSAIAMAINGIMVDNGYFTDNYAPYAVGCDISPGKTLNTSLPVEDAWLKENNIRQVRSIQVQFYASRKGANALAFDTEPLFLRTNHFMRNQEGPKASGQEIYRKKDLAVYSLGGTEFMVKNEGDFHNNYNLRDLYVNGVKCDAKSRLIYQKIFSHCVSSFDLGIQESFFRENRMDRISEIQFYFDIASQDKSVGKYSTDIITVTLDENGAPVK